MKKNSLYTSGYQPNWPTNFVSELDSSVPLGNGAHSPRWVESPGSQQKAQSKSQFTGKRKTVTGAHITIFGRTETRQKKN